MGTLPGRSALVQAAEAVHTVLTDRAYQSDQSELRRPESSARGHAHV
jgi:hypothetical protein